MRYRSFPLVCGAVITSLCLSLTAGASQSHSSAPNAMVSRAGDNTIYLHWDAGSDEADLATSSLRLTSAQDVEILTKLVDRSGRIVMRAALRNVSSSERFRVRGRLVHKVVAGDGSSTLLRSSGYHRLLRPGESVVAHFSYALEQGNHTATTDFVAK